MLVSRRPLLRAAAAAPALSLPGILRAQSQTASVSGILDGTAVFWNVQPA